MLEWELYYWIGDRNPEENDSDTGAAREAALATANLF